MANCCRKTVINKKFILLSLGVLIAAAVGSMIGNWISSPTDKTLQTLAERLTSSTRMLTDSVNKMIPVVDNVDDNVKVLAKKVDELDLGRSEAVDIVGMDKLLASVSALNKKVSGMSKTVDLVDKRIVNVEKDFAEGYEKLTRDIKKIEFAKIDYFRTSDGAKLQGFDPNKARRILCINRNRTKCLPSVDAVMPKIPKGFVRECILYESDLHCGKSKKFN